MKAPTCVHRHFQKVFGIRDAAQSVCKYVTCNRNQHIQIRTCTVEVDVNAHTRVAAPVTVLILMRLRALVNDSPMAFAPVTAYRFPLQLKDSDCGLYVSDSVAI